MSTAIHSSRLFGFDLIRLISFFAIASFHISLIHWGSTDIFISARSDIIRSVESVSRAFSFSGFTIVFITSILIALSSSSLKHRARLFTFLFVGWIAFSALIYNPSAFFSWDIYPLIFLGILTASFAEKAGKRFASHLTVLGILMLWIPFWKAAPFLNVPEGIRHVFGFADCRHAVSEWPIFPWIGLIWAGYGCGMHLRKIRESGRARVLRLTWFEGLSWGVILTCSLPQWGAFYHVRLGNFFACEAYRQEPYVFMSHFVWVAFAVRLCVDGRVNRWLGRFSLSHFVSNLAISRKFWLAYFLNYLLAHLLSFIVTSSGVEQTTWEVPTIALIAVGFVPLTELVTRLFIGIFFTGEPQKAPNELARI